MLDEALRVVDRRAGEAERLAVDFAAVLEEDVAGCVEYTGHPVLEAPSREARHLRVARLESDEPGPVRDERVPERLRKALSVADGPGLRIARAARREKHVFGPQREVLRHDEESVLERLDRRDGAVREDRHLLVAEEVAECVDDRRRLFVGGEDASVGHALRAHAEGLESADDLPRRAFAHGLGDELRARARDASPRDVVEELLGRDVLREVAASVRRHQHLRAEARLALEDEAGDVALGGDGRGEHAGGSAADDGELHGTMRKRGGVHHFTFTTIGSPEPFVSNASGGEGGDMFPAASNAVTWAT